MPYINNPLGTPLLDPISKQTGKREDNASKATRVNNLSIKGLARPLSIPLQHQDHGTTNQFQWTSIELGYQEGTGEGKEEAHREGMRPESKMLESKEGYRVHVSIAESKGTLLTIAPPNRNTPTCAPLNLLIGALRTMRANPGLQQ